MNNKSSKCLHALQKSGVEKIFEAYKWVQEHRHEFNKEVYGPVLVEVYMSESRFYSLLVFLPGLIHYWVNLQVNVSNQSHAGYLEGQVAYYTWKVVLDILWSFLLLWKQFLPNFFNTHTVKILAIFFTFFFLDLDILEFWVFSPYIIPGLDFLLLFVDIVGSMVKTKGYFNGGQGMWGERSNQTFCLVVIVRSGREDILFEGKV